jgi:hypothetical protein
LNKYLLFILLIIFCFSFANGKFIVDESIYFDQNLDESFYAFGNNVDIYSNISGSLIIAGGTVNINDGSYIKNKHTTILADNVKIDGDLSGDVFIIASSVYISKNAFFNSDVRITAANVYFSGDARHLSVNTNKLTLDGRVRGDLFVNTKSIESDKNTLVEGTFTLSADYYNKNAGTFRNGILGFNKNKKFDIGLQGLKNAISLLIFGLFIIWFASKTKKSLQKIYDYDLTRSFLYGMITLIALPIVILLLFFTGLSSILSLLFSGIFLLLLIIGYFLGTLRLGYEFLKRTNVVSNDVFNLFIGVLILFLFSIIPFIGGIVSIIVIICGIGIAKKILLNVYYGTPIFVNKKKTIKKIVKKKVSKKVKKTKVKSKKSKIN